MHVTLPLIFLYLFAPWSSCASDDYWEDRDAFIKEEESQTLGSSIVLSTKEKAANQILMGYKLSEYDAGFERPGIFAPGRHFFHARTDVEKSKVFSFIQRLPKGAALHGHQLSLTSFDYLLSLTYKDNLYACTVNGRLRLIFMEGPDQDSGCSWTLISVLRKQDPEYDGWVRTQLTLVVDDPWKAYPSFNDIWANFEGIYDTITPLLTYRPVFQEAFYHALEELYEDNVMYIEFRDILSPVYELDGTTHNPQESVGLYQEVIEDFQKDHPGFLGARLIYTPRRRIDNSTLETHIELVKDLKKAYPDLVAGFDLAGQEDKGEPLAEFIELLVEASQDVDFFFHAAETNWFGTSSDMNLVDAVLLGTKRIGHGYGLMKHPLVMEVVKNQSIAVEVCPISNQVLMLVDDMRNHPAASLIAQGFPVVISYDNPSFWGVKGLSYDFYMAFMGIASRNADLRLLKQFAKNSLMYSAMPAKEKELAIRAWEGRWENFLDEVINEEKKVIIYKTQK